jgi:MoxR-like ATPase
MIAQDAASVSRSFVDQAVRVREKLTESIVGQDEVLDQLLICALTGSHALIVGAPGLAKTLMVKALARSLNLKFNRIQFTPDLMPSDITGYELLARSADGNESIMKFRRGLRLLPHSNR